MSETNPRWPLYIVSKGRWRRQLTSRELDRLGLAHTVIVESDEIPQYAVHRVPRATLLTLDPAFARDYDPCDDLGHSKLLGPGPARNHAWAHAQDQGAAWHWVMDDNIWKFYRLHKNRKVPVEDGSLFHHMEVFVSRYQNIAIAGPNYEAHAKRRQTLPPFTLNTRIYSCLLIRNDLPVRWRGRYNEDTDLSLRCLKAGWCTVQFNAWLQNKATTQRLRGGNTDAFYRHDGTKPKSDLLVALHPDVARLTYQWGRWHHHVNYRPFKRTALTEA